MNRSITVTARFLPIEKTALEQVAEREHRSRSELLRELVRSKAREHGLWPPAPMGLTSPYKCCKPR